jgi:transcriptional/translational regulatory protein YebC/TACO1
MAGHSKWANIRLRKGKQDAERGKAFTKLSREIIVAAREGGGNPDGNARLRLAIQKARDASMPMDKIKNAIQRGTGEVEGAHYEEIVYEGYGPGGTAVMVEIMTDNRNRTVSEIRNIFSRAEAESFDVITEPEDLNPVRQALTEASIAFAVAEVTRLPKSTVSLSGKEAQQMLRLMEQLEDHDDVQNVHANFDISESVMAALT